MNKLLFVLLVLAPAILFSQKKQGMPLIDSLVGSLLQMNEDTNKVKQLALISYTYSVINPDEGIKYGEQAMKLADNLHWKKGIATANVDIAINLDAMSKYAKALEYNVTAFELYKEMEDSNGMAAVYANMGLIYHTQSDYSKALKCYFDALKINTDLNDKKTQGIITENIGTLYFEQKNFTKTLKYYSQALAISEDLNDRVGKARSLGNIGMVLNEQGNYNKALDNHFMALKINEELGYKKSIQINLANIGYVYSQTKNYDSALKYQVMALKISEELKSKNSIAINMGNIGETYFSMAVNDGLKSFKTENLKKSIKYLNDAILICDEIGFLGPMTEFSKYISDAYWLTGDYKKALEAFKQHDALKDSAFSDENKMLLSKMESQHELDMKDKDIAIKSKQIEIAKLEEANKSKETVIYIGGILFLLLAAVLVIAKFRNSIRKQRKVLREIAQIQSHEIRGPLSRILGLVHLFNYEDINDPVNGQIMQYITLSATEIDDIINTVVNKTYMGEKSKNNDDGFKRN